MSLSMSSKLTGFKLSTSPEFKLYSLPAIPSGAIVVVNTDWFNELLLSCKSDFHLTLFSLKGVPFLSGPFPGKCDEDGFFVPNVPVFSGSVSLPSSESDQGEVKHFTLTKKYLFDGSECIFIEFPMEDPLQKTSKYNKECIAVYSSPPDCKIKEVFDPNSRKWPLPCTPK